MLYDVNPVSPFFDNPNPTCEKDCRFQEGVGNRTAAYYPPIYDKHGNNTNPDGNITSRQITCGICSKIWQSSTQYGKTTYTELV